MIHKLKLNVDFIYPILQGDKTFEIRENDHGFQKGDMVNFVVVGDAGRMQDHRGMIREIEHRTYEITYVINGWGLKNGYVVFGIREKK